MRQSKTLKRFGDGKLARTTWLGHYIPSFLFHAAHNDYDCIWLDLEHRAMSELQVQSLLAYSHLFDIDVMVRPPTREKVALYRYLEEGAAGLLIPHVSTPEEAEELVAAIKFPPVGERGIDNAGLDADYGIHDAANYTAWANRETFLAVQIETPLAVHNAEAIAAVEGVDLIFLGPGDLQLRLDLENQMALSEAIEIVNNACQKAGKPWGCPAPTTEMLTSAHQQGAQLVVISKESGGWRSELKRGIDIFASTCEGGL
ncbi:MAG: aldolase/citrate lyase family protein [Pirellulales bacterium]|nr:aldolase/citrate lyase family protein [Pirellulales bacterium]